MKVRRFVDRKSLDAALAQRLKQAIEDVATTAVMLSGGHAPRPAYAQLGAQTLRPPPALHILYSDERYVPATSDASNYHASQPLLTALALPQDRVLRVRTDLSLEDAAADYERRLARLFESSARISLGLLGMGADGHTASLFTHTDLERAHERLAIAVQRPDGMSAVSATPQALGHVDRILMVVVGMEKRAALAAFLARDPKLVAWQAVARCRDIEVWCENAP